MAKKVCKQCKRFVEANQCSLCKSNQFSTNWQGRINMLDTSHSLIAKKLNLASKGEYAVKVR